MNLYKKYTENTQPSMKNYVTRMDKYLYLHTNTKKNTQENVKTTTGRVRQRINL